MQVPGGCAQPDRRPNSALSSEDGARDVPSQGEILGELTGRKLMLCLHPPGQETVGRKHFAGWVLVCIWSSAAPSSRDALLGDAGPF